MFWLNLIRPRLNMITAQAPNLGDTSEFGPRDRGNLRQTTTEPTNNPQRNAAAITPASTFKIFNAMVALETGVVP